MDESRFWEPWQPQIGQRVRVRLSGECPHGFFGEPHTHELDGKRGEVIDPHTPLLKHYGDKHGHFYWVCFDPPVMTAMYGNPAPVAGEHFAACELEPLDDEADA